LRLVTQGRERIGSSWSRGDPHIRTQMFKKSMDRDYNKEIEYLARQLSRDESLIIKQGSARFKELFGRLTTLYLFYRYLAERGIANNAPKGVRILYAKLADSLIGILRLLQAGHPGPATIVLRSLFETSVNLQIILMGNVQERSKLFEDFLFIQRINYSNKPSISDQQRNENELRLREVRANYHPKYPNSWCWKIVPSKNTRKGVHNNPTFKELCEYIGHPERYDIYGDLSYSTHPVPSYEGWMRRDDGHIELGSQFGHQIVGVAKISIAYAAESLIKIIQFLKPEDKAYLINCIVYLIPKKKDRPVTK